MKASDFDKKFEAGGNILAHLDVAQIRRPGDETRRLRLDLPAWMLAALDEEARRLGVTRNSLITMWLAERMLKWPGDERR